jgi:tetratricopeptide (TPR) repeat protein
MVMSVVVATPRCRISSGIVLESTIRTWLEATAGRRPPTGLSVEEATASVEAVALCIGQGHLEIDDGVLDRLYASWAAFRGPQRLSAETFRRLADLHRLLSETKWEQDLFAEQTELLARLAFGAWSQCLRFGSYQAMASWQASCASHVLSIDSIRCFLELPIERRSASLSNRFLSDPAVLLALCQRLIEERNRSPVLVAAEVGWLFAWLEANGDALLPAERSYLKAEIALCAVSAERLLGKLADARMWLGSAEASLRSCAETAWLLPKIEFVKLALEHDCLKLGSVIDRVSSVIADLEKLGPSPELLRCRYLEASTLKNAGRGEEARERFEGLLTYELLETDDLLHGLVLVSVGELEALRGDHDGALLRLTEALPYLEKSRTSWAIAHVKATLGEVLRGRGLLTAAIDSYRLAVRLYAELEMEWDVAYVRIILAESLIAAQREPEAVAELLAALPILEREKIVPAAIAAVGLLRESLARQSLDPQLLRRLRESLAPSVSGARL